MKITLRKPEATVGAWAWRLALGPASVADGVVSICSMGFVSLGANLAVAKNLARARVAVPVSCEHVGDLFGSNQGAHYVACRKCRQPLDENTLTDRG